MFLFTTSPGGIKSCVGLFGAAQLRTVANPVDADDEDLNETAEAAQRQSNAESEAQQLVESYWNWYVTVRVHIIEMPLDCWCRFPSIWRSSFDYFSNVSVRETYSPQKQVLFCNQRWSAH